MNGGDSSKEMNAIFHRSSPCPALERAGLRRACLIMFRKYSLVIVIYFYTLVCGSLAILMAFVDFTGRSTHLLSRLWAWLILKTCGIRVVIHGLEKLRPDEPKIYMSNHRSYIDVWSIVAYFPVDMKFVAKKELTRIPVFGQALYMLGHIIIDREDRGQSFASLDRAAQKVREGRNVLIFPEGTRAPAGRLGEFKKGGFVLAIKAGVPIVPVSVSGSSSLLPKDSYDVRSGQVEIFIGDQIPTSGFTIEKKEPLIERVRAEIVKNLDLAPPDIPKK
jgi:1-acyl-sn-glycerol-3-phosphate acyltransferase